MIYATDTRAIGSSYGLDEVAYLNEKSKQGWELVSAYTSSGFIHYIFREVIQIV